MQRPGFIARQSSHPHGLLGRIIAWIMEWETAAQNRLALSALSVRDGEDILELGFGHGATLELLAGLTPGGRVAGMDVSTDMLDLATLRCARRVPSSQFDLRAGDSRRLPFPDAAFSGVLAVHVVYFWTDPLEHLREVHRVLRDGGRFILAFRDASDPAAADFPSPPYTFRSRTEIRDLLLTAGFSIVEEVETLEEAASFSILRALR